MDKLKYYRLERIYCFRFGIYNKKDVLTGYIEQKRVGGHFYWCFLPIMDGKASMLYYLRSHLSEITYILENIRQWRKEKLV